VSTETEDVSQELIAALVHFVAATETLHDSIKTNDKDAVIGSVEALYAARNEVQDLLARFPEDEPARGGDVDALNDRGKPGSLDETWGSRGYAGACPKGHAFKGELTGPETPDTFLMECPTMFCGMIEMEASDAK
jgi:hypothetical protein